MEGRHSTGSDERLAGLVRLARAIADARSLEDLAERACEEARFAFDARSVSLTRIEREHGTARVIVNVGHLAAGEERFPSEETYEIATYPMLGLMIDEARPWAMTLDSPERDEAERDLLIRMGAYSALAAPVLAEGRIWGELFATRGADAEPYDDDDLAFAQAFAGMMSAGLAQVEHLARVERMAYQDTLTGLGNRRLVEERLDVALESYRATGAHVTVVMADVNRLKQANDEFGHEAGDRALIAVANALSAATGKVPGAIAARLGGDEFCAVLPGYGLSVGEALASAFLRGSRSAPYGVSVACGLSSTELIPGVITAARLFAMADGAQYAAKRTLADHPVIATPGVTALDRRAFDRRDGQPGLLAVALTALAGQTGKPPVDRLAAAASALAGALKSTGWVVSRIRDGAAIPVVHSASREGVLVSASIPAPAGADWLKQARSSGTVVLADDEVPLAAVRGAARVVAAGSGDWLVELLCDGDPPPPEAPGVLRAAVGVALGG